VKTQDCVRPPFPNICEDFRKYFRHSRTHVRCDTPHRRSTHTEKRTRAAQPRAQTTTLALPYQKGQDLHESWAPGPLPSLLSRRGATPLHSDGCHLPRPVRVAPPSLHTSLLHPVTSPWSLLLGVHQAVSVSRVLSSGDGRNLDLRTVALLVIGTHTPHHMTAHAAHGTPQCTPRRSSHHAAHGTLQFTRDRTRNLSGVWL